MTTLVIVIIVLALIFDFINGFHDAANSIATIVSTKVLTPLQAVLWAATFNFVAFFIFKDHAVANTIAKTVIDNYITLQVIMAGLLAAIFWNLLTWWYGIPSSSSHTLIGGFAGAAFAHACWFNGAWVPFGEVVEMDKITKTIYFIILAPLIGMFISIVITLVTIRRNVYGKIGLILIATMGLIFIFNSFRASKLEDNLSKFYKIDKYKKELIKDSNDMEVRRKYSHALANFEATRHLLADFDKLGSDSIAAKIASQVDLKYLEVSKLKDIVSKKLKIDFLRKATFYDPSVKLRYEANIAILDSCKPIFNNFSMIGPDSTAHAVALQLGITKIGDYDKFCSGFNVNIQKGLKEELERADNRILLWSIVTIIGIFIVCYIWCERIKTPTASRMSNMFKKLQLVSSAAFSVGHGGNDAQKVMGIIGATLIASGSIHEFRELPNWVPLACYTAIGLGTLSGGWKIIKTMGTKITKVTPLEGVSAETAGAITLFLTEQMGIPVSTTHTITGAIIGVGSTKRLSAVRWGVTRSLLIAWLITIPVSALLAGLFFMILSLAGI